MKIRRTVIFAVLTVVVPPIGVLHAQFANSPGAIITAQNVAPRSDARRPEVCTEQYNPVCARLAGAVKTYSNECFARIAGAEVIAQDPCTDKAPAPLK